MEFNSLTYGIFLPIVFAVYWVLPHKFRWSLLLIASYYFYMSWNANYLVLIVFTTFVSYLAALIIEKSDKKGIRKTALVVNIIVSLGVLFFFKYFQFFDNSLVLLLNKFAIQLHPITLNILLPVGISFYTFQTLSYSIDVYKGTCQAEHHFGKYAAFISFFPQLVAGPIERTQNLLPQITEERKFDYEQATYGLKLMAWGFFKKLVIADNVAKIVDNIYNSLNDYSGFSLVLATILFTFQIYCDFSGYSDIAIGTAKTLGIDLMTNFKSPYFSTSIKEFWSRWHISLSTWFRDYVYIPLGGNRCGKIRKNLNLIITFLVSGLWHGANWTYIFWGGVHGVAQVIEKNLFPKSKKNKSKILWWLKVLVVFVFCCFTWIFFRANTLADAGYVLTHMFSGIGNFTAYIKNGIIDINITNFDLLKIFAAVLILSVFDFLSLRFDVINLISKNKCFIRYSFYFVILIIIIFFRATEASTFVYFQF
ncbi:MAG: MBOAT family protein [Ruminococcus sp.]|nr:MBOAT family protein [Ruminococcus sp.]